MYDYQFYPPIPPTSFTFSVLVDAPVRTNLSLSPVSALLFPLGKVDIRFSGLIVAILDFLITFLVKRSLARVPDPSRTSWPTYSEILSYPEFNRLMQSAVEGNLPIPASTLNAQSNEPLDSSGHSAPFTPDNLSIALMLISTIAPYDDSPATSFIVPLFEFPGAPGNLIIALGLLIAQFLAEKDGGDYRAEP